MDYNTESDTFHWFGAGSTTMVDVAKEMVSYLSNASVPAPNSAGLKSMDIWEGDI